MTENTQTTKHPVPDAKNPLRGPFGGRAIYLGRIFGIDIGLDLSWIVIFALVTVSLRANFAMRFEDWPMQLGWIAAVVTSVTFFICLLLHEIGHSVVSNALGLPIHSITLFIFGGVARLTREPDRPRDEFLIAIAGPLVSVALGIIFLGLALMIPDTSPGLQAASSICQWLGQINLILVIFNCIPGFPLDGGRVFRSIIWAISGDYEKATRIAAGGGSAFAYFLISMGILIALLGNNWVSGLWFVFIGWFLLGAARSSVTRLYMKEGLGGIPVRGVFEDHCCRVPGSMSVAELIQGPILSQGRRTFFPEAFGKPMGLLTLQEVKGVPEEDRATTPVQAIATPLEKLHTIGPNDSLWQATEIMDSEGVNQLPVVENGELLGLLTREMVLRVLRAQMELRGR